MTVGFLTFGRDDLGYGLEIVRREIEQAGHKAYRVTPKTAKCCDALIFSLFWFEHLFMLADWMRKAGIKKTDAKRPRIIIGGFNTFNPVPMLAYADAVIVGDGEGVGVLAVSGDYSHPSILTDGKHPVKWNNTKTLVPICHETNGIARIELSRGCRCRCKFCAVAHLKPYREASVEDVKACLASTKLKRVSLFAPEPTMHSKDEEMTALCRRAGKSRQDSDVRLDRLALRADSVPRVGIEGLSERLRRSVNKPYTDDAIIEAVRDGIKRGRRGMFMYMILDLPTESPEDWECFGALLRKIGELPGAEGFLLKPSPSVFMPTPHTPMAGDPINWSRDCGGMWAEFFGRGDNRRWRVLMAERSRVFSPHMRIMQMMATRAGAEFYDVEKTLNARKIIKISSGRLTVAGKKELERELEARGLIELYCGSRDNGPWSIVNA